MTLNTFRSTDSGASALTLNNTAGNLISILDAVLVNGYSLGTVTSITRVGSVATILFSAAHGLAEFGNVATISGADQAEYNGVHDLTWVSTTQMSFTVTGTPATPATGTITAVKAGAGWTKPYSGTNLAAYKQGTGSNGFYLYIDDTTTTYARAIGYETMASISDTTGNPFPTPAQLSGGCILPKSNGTANRDWIIVATEKDFYFLDAFDGVDNNNGLSFFGDFDSFMSGDSFGTAIITGGSTSLPNRDGVMKLNDFGLNDAFSGHYVTRDHNQTIGAITSNSIGSALSSINSSPYAGQNGLTYPDPITNDLILDDIYIIAAGERRGKFPGLLYPVHTQPLPHLDTFAYNGKIYLSLKGYSSGECFLEISNTR